MSNNKIQKTLIQKYEKMERKSIKIIKLTLASALILIIVTLILGYFADSDKTDDFGKSRLDFEDAVKVINELD